MILFRKAVLIIHGFAGGTYDEENLANFLEQNYRLDVYSFTLPGHDKRTLKPVPYQDWIKESENQLNKLIKCGYKSIFVIGHSMGGIIATYLANNYSQVKKVVLAAPAFNFLTSSDNSSIKEEVLGGISAFKENSKSEIISRFLKLPISSIRELQKISSKYKTEYINLNVPTLIVQGKKDTLVPYENSKRIYEKLKCKKEIIYLENITHDIFREANIDLYVSIEKFLLK